MNWRDYAFQLLDLWEGDSLTAYVCPAGHPTIARGATRYLDGSLVKMGDTVTQDESNDLTYALIERWAQRIEPYIKNDDWRDGKKFAALVCFSYNIGVRAFRESTVLARINNYDTDERIAEAWSWWKKANGKVLRGLMRRRDDVYEFAFGYDPYLVDDEELRKEYS